MAISPRRGEVRDIRVRAGDPLPVAIRLWDMPFSFHVRAGRTVNGPVLLGLEIHPDDGATITSDTLKQIPAKRLAAAAAKLVVFKGDDEVGGQLAGPDFINFQRPERKRDTTSRGRGRPIHYEEDHYVEVARLAIEARADGTSAAAAVAEAFGIERSTAYAHITRARQMGLIDRHGAAPQGSSSSKREEH